MSGTYVVYPIFFFFNAYHWPRLASGLCAFSFQKLHFIWTQVGFGFQNSSNFTEHLIFAQKNPPKPNLASAITEFAELLLVSIFIDRSGWHNTSNHGIVGEIVRSASPETSLWTEKDDGFLSPENQLGRSSEAWV
jgi:hypothetical protein